MSWLTIDVATYLALVVGVMGLFCGGGKLIVRLKNAQKQIQKVKSGNALQAGGDIIIDMSNHNSAESVAKLEEERLKKSHDLHIVKKLLKLLPYKETISYLERSHITGVPYEFSRRLDTVEEYSNVCYQILNANVESAKLKLVESVSNFNDVVTEFLGVDDITKEPLMLTPPFHWRTNGSEEIYRVAQEKLRKSAMSVKDDYDKLIMAMNLEGFIINEI
ncbi:hypothetical protein ABDZ30_15420 [Aeromonas veronii]|uniref:hypothetical protein n=1 Tax=Aeromonas veronii TaxID=654 RepID=UPI0031FBA7CB